MKCGGHAGEYYANPEGIELEYANFYSRSTPPALGG